MRQLNVGLTEEQKAKRKSSLGGSDANILFSGDNKAILDLWLLKTGQKDPDNLDDVLPVVMGQFTEPLNIYWYERISGNDVYAEGREAMHSELDFMTCTLDGQTRVNGCEAIFEAKHVNAFSKIEDVVQKYMPQLHHNMFVCGLDRAVLSVFKGTLEYEFYEVEADFFYTTELIEAEKHFWECVQSGSTPVEIETPPAPKVIKEFRTVDMSTSNEWGNHAASWLENKKPAKLFKDSEKEIKALMEEDVGEAFGNGIQCKRAKNGNLKITERKEK